MTHESIIERLSRNSFSLCLCVIEKACNYVCKRETLRVHKSNDTNGFQGDLRHEEVEMETLMSET